MSFKEGSDVIDLCDSSASESDSAGRRNLKSPVIDEDVSCNHTTSKRKKKRTCLAFVEGPNKKGSITADEPVPLNLPVLILRTEPREQVEVTQDLFPLMEETRRNLQGSGVCFCQSPTLLHIQQCDKWSCGFRNLQMLLSALLPLLSANHSYFIDRPVESPGAVDIVSILQIQHLLEEAWNAGMDPKGCEHYRGRLSHTNAWIGAVEVATALVFCKLDATIVQFITVPESRRQLGAFCEAYFTQCHGCCSSQDEPGTRTSHTMALRLLAGLNHKSQRDVQRCASSTCTCRPTIPLYLQYQGHSVAIVGVEYEVNQNDRVSFPTHWDVSNLLVLDPMLKGGAITAALKRRDLRPLRRSCLELQSRDCQIILCSSEEWSKQPLAVVTAEAEAVVRYRQSRRL